MPTAIEDHLADFLDDKIGAAVEGDVLFDLELLDTSYATVTKERFVQIDDGESDFAPTSGGEDVAEFDGNVTLIVGRKLVKGERVHRRQARSDAIEIAMALAKLFFDDPTMGNRVNDSRVLRCLRGWANIKSVPYCVMNLPLIINETGAPQ